jgi:glycosyltransferase involved in cell wall biosynthesis
MVSNNQGRFMRKILLVIPTLEHSGAGTQVSLLAQRLPRDDFEPRICALGGEGPVAAPLRSTGLVVQTLGRPRIFNLSALRRFRRLVQDFRPDVIHAWGRSSLRLAFLNGAGRNCRLLVSSPLPPRERGPCLGRLERWLLGRVDGIIAQGPAEAESYQRLGLPADKVMVVPPGVADSGTRLAERGAGRLLLCGGPLEPHKGYRDAIWAFDILQFLYPDLALGIFGAGSDRSRLERFAALTGAGRHVHFAGSQADPAALMARAEVIWVPSRAEGGINVALEAMALGRPVVASHLHGLAEVITDGETGFLVPPGNKIELARQTRRLLDDAALARRLGEAGRRRARAHFAAADLVRRLADLYSSAHLKMAA